MSVCGYCCGGLSYPQLGSDQMRLSTSVETVLARLSFPPPKSIPTRNKNARRCALSRLSTVKAISQFPRVSAVGAASPALQTHRVMGSPCLLRSGCHPPLPQDSVSSSLSWAPDLPEPQGAQASHFSSSTHRQLAAEFCALVS